jgi:hypothetical protein
MDLYMPTPYKTRRFELFKKGHPDEAPDARNKTTGY